MIWNYWINSCCSVLLLVWTIVCKSSQNSISCTYRWAAYLLFVWNIVVSSVLWNSGSFIFFLHDNLYMRYSVYYSGHSKACFCLDYFKKGTKSYFEFEYLDLIAQHINTLIMENNWHEWEYQEIWWWHISLVVRV